MFFFIILLFSYFFNMQYICGALPEGQYKSYSGIDIKKAFATSFSKQIKTIPSMPVIDINSQKECKENMITGELEERQKEAMVESSIDKQFKEIERINPEYVWPLYLNFISSENRRNPRYGETPQHYSYPSLNLNPIKGQPQVSPLTEVN